MKAPANTHRNASQITYWRKRNYYIIHANGRRIVPLPVYEDALVHVPKHLQIFNHIITLWIDGVKYTDKHLGDLVIALLFHSALDDMFVEPNVRDLVGIDFQKLASLPSYLSVMVWALVFIKPSKMLQSIKDDIRMRIRYYIRYVCGSDIRFKCIQDQLMYATGAGVRTPDYLLDCISLPVNQGEHESVLKILSVPGRNYFVETH